MASLSTFLSLDSLKKLKQIKIKQHILGGIFIIFLFILAIIITSAVRFLAKNLNQAFALDETTTTEFVEVDLPGFRVVAKKLGIPIPIDEPVPEEEAEKIPSADTIIIEAAVTSTATSTVSATSTIATSTISDTATSTATTTKSSVKKSRRR